MAITRAKTPTRRTAESKHASRAEVEAALDEMPDHYIECRRRGHRWKSSNVPIWDAENHVFEELLRCTRGCKVRKIEVISETGALLLSKIDYKDAPDYLLKGIGRVVTDGRDAIRLASTLRRVNGKG